MVHKVINYCSREFKIYAEAERITVPEAPVETIGAMCTVERYHAALRRSYKCISKNLPKSTNNADCLPMVFRSEQHGGI